MRLGLMSDTHGNLDFMQRAADRMVGEFRVEVIIHLGDDCADTSSLKVHGVRILGVPGFYEAAWKDGTVPRRRIEEFGGIKFLLSHAQTPHANEGPKDINPARARSHHGCDVLLCGHTHKYRAEEAIGGLIVVNPGHLKSEEDRGSPATFAIVEAKFPRLGVEIYELGGALVEACSFVIVGAK